MAKKGMKRANITHVRPRNQQAAVPEIQGNAKHNKTKANPIIAGTNPPSQKVYHTTPYCTKDKEDRILNDIYPAIDTDLARDNLQSDLTFADLQDFSTNNPMI